MRLDAPVLPLDELLDELGVVLDVDGLLGVVFGLPVDPVPLLLPAPPELRRAFVKMNALAPDPERPVLLPDALEELELLDPADPLSAPMPPCFKHPETVTVSPREPRL